MRKCIICTCLDARVFVAAASERESIYFPSLPLSLSLSRRWFTVECESHRMRTRRDQWRGHCRYNYLLWQSVAKRSVACTEAMQDMWFNLLDQVKWWWREDSCQVLCPLDWTVCRGSYHCCRKHQTHCHSRSPCDWGKKWHLLPSPSISPSCWWIASH